MSQFFKRLQTKKKIEKENKRILTIESYHPFQSSRENQTYKIHIHFLPFAPTLRTFMRMSSYKIDWSRTESMGFLSFCVTYILLSFVRLFSSFFYPSVRPTPCLNSQKESMMMTDKEKQQLTHKERYSLKLGHLHCLSIDTYNKMKILKDTQYSFSYFL